MLLRILGEVALGLLAAGIAMAIAVPAAMQFGFVGRPWLAGVATAGSIVACVAIGERNHKRRKPRVSP